MMLGSILSRTHALFVPSLAVTLIAVLSGNRVLGVPPPNDDFADAQVVSGEMGSVPGTTVGATREAGELDHFAGDCGTSVW
jgi:hypothetical protein